MKDRGLIPRIHLKLMTLYASSVVNLYLRIRECVNDGIVDYRRFGQNCRH